MKRTSISRKPQSYFLIIFCNVWSPLRSCAQSWQHSRGWTLNRRCLSDEMQCNTTSVSLTLLSTVAQMSQEKPTFSVLLSKCKSKRGKHRNWAKIGSGSNLKSKFSEPGMSPKSLGEITFQAERAASVDWQSWKINLLNLTDQVSTLNSTTHAMYQE